MTPKLALAQINPTVGDIDGNVARILAAYEQAKAQGAELVVFPELAITGYPPEDLILMPAFVEKSMQAAQALATKTTNGAAMIVGCPWREGAGKVYSPSPQGAWDAKQQIYNAALLLDGGKVAHVAHKTLLPNYSVFDEKRIFTPGEGTHVANWRGMKLGLLVCEDVWSERLPAQLKVQGAELVVVINASPFEAGKISRRHAVAARAVAAAGVPLVYVNMVGGQDDIVFDGGSFVMDAKGKVTVQAPEFADGVFVSGTHPLQGREETLWSAMKTGLADYVRKNGFPGVVLGLSGGIDSALTAAVAVDALGADKVKGVLLPSPYTSKDSVEDALETGKLLGIETMNVPITAGMEIIGEVMNPIFRDAAWMEDVSIGGNVQARLRGLTLMSISNRYGWMLLSTGNKSEIAVGYSTLYGDSCGGYNVLKDLYKTQVYELARWRNQQGKVIPERSITKAPTAELAPGQKDSDQLPVYEILDAILLLHLEGRQSAEDIIAKGYDKAVVEKILRLVRLNEYKRRQSCPGVKLSSMLFGKDRRYPLTNKF